MRKFEVPYNFDKELLNTYTKYKDNITFAYMPTFIEDMKDARYSQMNEIYPKDRFEYESHIDNLLNNKIKPAILFQNPETTINDNTIKYYLNLGVSNFIVFHDEVALKIKQLSPNSHITASVTKRLTLKDIIENQNKYYNIYDNIVLFFPFNRALAKLKYLPQNLNYTFLVASHCSYECNVCMEHWFRRDFSEKFEKFCYKDTKKEIYIDPNHLSLFDKYAYSYKIQGRDIGTQNIEKLIINYITAPIYNLDNNNEKDLFLSKYKSFDRIYRIENEYKLETITNNIFAYYNSSVSSKYLQI